jgi:hypothetical protein
MSKMNSVVQPYDDRGRMAKFYQNVFGCRHGCLGRRWATMSLRRQPKQTRAGLRS